MKRPRAEVVDALQSGGTYTVNKLVRTTGVSPVAVRRALRLLLERGQVGRMRVEGEADRWWWIGEGKDATNDT